MTKYDNDWKFEFSVKKNEFKFIRGKVYDKTACLLTSCGVAFGGINDP